MDPSRIWSCGRGLGLPCSAGGSRWGDFSLLRSGSGGLDHPDPGKDGGDPCTRDGGLRSDPGENLLLAIAKAGDGDAVCVVPFLKASSWRCSRPLSATSGGNPRSVDRMAAALWCRLPPWGRHSWRCTRARGTRGRRRWWSGASSFTLMMADLGGMVLWRLGV